MKAARLRLQVPAAVLGWCALLAFTGGASAQEPSEDGVMASDAEADAAQTAPGVNPKDNITKAEVIIQHDSLESGLAVTTLAFKYDIAFDAHWGGNIELPITNLQGPAQAAGHGGARALLVDNFELPAPAARFSETGIGDLRLRVRNVQTKGRISLIAAAEVVAPIADSDLTGAGKWQFNPVLGAVYAFNQQTFAFLGYKHYFSVAGDNQREDIDRSEVRALFARLFANATWALGDIKYSKSHAGVGAETIDLEGEYGTMLTRSLALSGRIGTSFLDSQRQVGFSLNLRKIF